MFLLNSLFPVETFFVFCLGVYILGTMYAVPGFDGVLQGNIGSGKVFTTLTCRIEVGLTLPVKTD